MESFARHYYGKPLWFGNNFFFDFFLNPHKNSIKLNRLNQQISHQSVHLSLETLMIIINEQPAQSAAASATATPYMTHVAHAAVWCPHS